MMDTSAEQNSGKIWLKKTKVKTKSKAWKEIVRERKLRGDTVICYAVIYNLPAEICMSWSDEDYKRFCSHDEACIEEIELKIFRRSYIRMKAKHIDSAGRRGAG